MYFFLDVQAACVEIPDPTGDDFEFSEGAGWMGDNIRSGGKNGNGVATQVTIPTIPTGAGTLKFTWNYIIGYCQEKGQVTAPQIQLEMDDDVKWKSSINLVTGDYPWDSKCGGAPDAWSPTHSESANIVGVDPGAEVVWRFACADRNVHLRLTSMKFCDPEDVTGGGIGGGSIFVIIVIVGFLGYFVSGFLYNKFVKGTESIKESIPQVEFWESFPDLVKDGCVYTIGRVKGKTEYSEL